MKKIFFVSALAICTLLFSCNGHHQSSKYEVLNRNKGVILVDNVSGEVYMMEIVVDKNKQINGSKWKKLGNPTLAE